MTLLNWIFVLWVAVGAALVAVLIVRSIVGLKEEDQLFLDPAEHQFEEEQAQVHKSLDRLKPIIRTLSVVTGGLTVALLGVFAVHMLP